MSLLRICGSRRARLAFNVTSALIAIAVGILTARHFIANGWPLGHAKVLGVLAAGGLFLAAYGFKAWGWSRLFHHSDRPATLGLAAAGGAASVTGLALPGRTDEVVRISVVRRFPGKRVGMSSIVLSLFLLGLVDNAALAPLAGVAAGISTPNMLVRAGLIVVAVAGVLAAGVVVFLPRIARTLRLERFRFVRWVVEHTATPKDAVRAWALVSISWILRGLAVLVLLDALSLGASIPLALGFLCASAAAAALPIAPAGAVAQAGAGAGVLAAAGMHVSQAAAFAVAAQGMVSLAGATALVLATSLSVARARLR